MLAERDYMSLEERFEPLTDERAKFVSKVYSGLTVSLGVCTAACVVAFQVFDKMPGGEVATIWNILRWVQLGLILLTLVIRLSGPFGWLWLMTFVTISGVTLAPILKIYLNPAVAGPNTVGAALGLTAVIFLTLTAYVRWSGKDFSYLGGFLTMALVAMIVAGLLFMFFPSPNASYWLACIGAVVFSGWILYDTSAVTRQYYVSNNVVGAILALYLDIFNLFLLLLQILSGNRRRD